MVDFIGWNRVFFTKIHQTGKVCQSYRRFQNTILNVVRWRLIFDKMRSSECGVRSEFPADSVTSTDGKEENGTRK